MFHRNKIRNVRRRGEPIHSRAPPHPPAAHAATWTIIPFSGVLQSLARGPPSWLRSQAVSILTLLSVKIPERDDTPWVLATASNGGGGTSGEASRLAVRGGAVSPPVSGSPRREPAHAKMKFHFFSFQIAHVTGANGFH